jgi:hypothetical protein
MDKVKVLGFVVMLTLGSSVAAVTNPANTNSIIDTPANPATSGVANSDTSMLGDPNECQISGQQGQIAPETDPSNCQSFVCCHQGTTYYWLQAADCSTCSTVKYNGSTGTSAYFQNCWDNGALYTTKTNIGNPVIDCNAGN